MTFYEFDALVEQTPYVESGMFFSELYLFLSLCAQHDVNLIIESGVKRGNSTRIIAATKKWPLISIDRMHFHIKPPQGVRFYKGNAFDLMPELLTKHASKRIAVLLDGPKNHKGRTLKDTCLTYPQVRLVGCHDTQPGFGETFHSHDPALRMQNGVLDRFIPEPWLSAKPNGPGLGVWVAA
jgi:hypothetical protein